MRPSELRVMTRDVSNPKFDKRHRYGTEAIGVFAKGTVFLYMPEHTDAGARYPDPPSAVARKSSGRIWDVLGWQATELYRASEPYAARTFGDLMLAEGWDAASFAREVLERLIAEGRVTLADAKAAYDAEIAAMDAAKKG